MKWIPVNEKLPDCDDKWGISKIVLCLDARGRVGLVFTKTAKGNYIMRDGLRGRSRRKLRKNYPMDAHTRPPAKRSP